MKPSRTYPVTQHILAGNDPRRRIYPQLIPFPRPSVSSHSDVPRFARPSTCGGLLGAEILRFSNRQWTARYGKRVNSMLENTLKHFSLRSINVNSQDKEQRGLVHTRHNLQNFLSDSTLTQPGRCSVSHGGSGHRGTIGHGAFPGAQRDVRLTCPRLDDRHCPWGFSLTDYDSASFSISLRE